MLRRWRNAKETRRTNGPTTPRTAASVDRHVHRTSALPTALRTMRVGGRFARGRPTSSPRWSVPGDDQDGPRRAPEHAFSDGTLPETLPSAPPVGAKDDEVGFPCVGMQHDRASRITVLLDGPNPDSFALSTLPQACQKFEAFALVPCKWMVLGHRMKNVKPRLACTSNAERSTEGVAACLRKIDRAHDRPNRCHVCTSIIDSHGSCPVFGCSS